MAAVKSSQSSAQPVPQPAAPLSNEAFAQQRRTELLNNQSWDQALKATLVATGVGAGLRGLQGLASQLGRNMESPASTVPAPMAVDVPIRTPAGKPKRRRKQADPQDWSYAITEPAKKVLDWGTKAVGSGLKATSDVLGGSQAETPAGLPPHLPRVIGGGIAGGAVGYKLTDWLLDQRRRKAVEEDVDDAKREYEEALYGKGAAAVDGLFEDLEKAALGLGDLPGAATGAYLTYALASPLIMGNIAYENAKKMRRKSLIDSAQKARMRMRYETSPAPVFATPSQRGPVAVPEEEEEKVADLSKLVGGAAEAGGKGLAGLFSSTGGGASNAAGGAFSGAVGTPGMSDKLTRAMAEHPRLFEALGLMGGGAALGAGFGALQRPGGSRGRGAIIGGLAGLGGGAGLAGGSAFMDTDAARQIKGTSMQAPTALAAGGGGAAIGLRAGRGLADLLGVKGRKGDNPHNDLQELDITRNRDWLPV